ncbi:MAG: hypothetical protein GIKADHBN_01715 [Phycisphaerales bacterium]|nr:hypothetical protein [Phycisphaerales bacterium]
MDAAAVIAGARPVRGGRIEPREHRAFPHEVAVEVRPHHVGKTAGAELDGKDVRRVVADRVAADRVQGREQVDPVGRGRVGAAGVADLVDRAGRAGVHAHAEVVVARDAVDGVGDAEVVGSHRDVAGRIHRAQAELRGVGSAERRLVLGDLVARHVQARGERRLVPEDRPDDAVVVEVAGIGAEVGDDRAQAGVRLGGGHRRSGEVPGHVGVHAEAGGEPLGVRRGRGRNVAAGGRAHAGGRGQVVEEEGAGLVGLDQRSDAEPCVPGTEQVRHVDDVVQSLRRGVIRADGVAGQARTAAGAVLRKGRGRAAGGHHQRNDHVASTHSPLLLCIPRKTLENSLQSRRPARHEPRALSPFPAGIRFRISAEPCWTHITRDTRAKDSSVQWPSPSWRRRTAEVRSGKLL